MAKILDVGQYITRLAPKLDKLELLRPRLAPSADL